ncbi:MAG: 4Fe-4S binding protein [Syntrophaceae bacterium]|nr:4Fe-4S binding protein [Syntrophaceae bacterium]
MNEKIWQNAAQASVSSGVIPIPITGTLIELLQMLINEKEAEFITIFTKPLNLDEIKAKSNLDDESLNKMLNNLMRNGIITGIASKSTGVIVYRLLAPIPGMFEFTLMRGKTTEREKKLAKLFEKLFKELADIVQSNYEPVINYVKENITPLTRVVPIEQCIEHKADAVMPYEDVKMIVDKFDTIAVSTCYCRHEKELLGKPCSVTKEKENCLTFGQPAEFIIKYNFGKKISKEEAIKILDKAQEDGLVHKAFHVKQDLANDEFAICNCCKCCCEIFQIYYMGGAPTQTYSSSLAKVSSSDCTGCGICEEMCPMEAIKMEDDIVVVNEDKCIGCGVCAHHCPVTAIKMERTGVRTVFVPPPKR